MNTLKFLAVGSSLDSGRDVVGRYRVREASLLPRFDPDAEAGSAMTPAVAASWWRRILNLLRWPATAPSAAPTANLAVANPGELTSSSKARESEPGPLVATVASPLAPRGARMQEGAQEPVQDEFRFQNVTVICNDLHDADFEIVAKPCGRRSPAKAVDQPAVVSA